MCRIALLLVALPLIALAQDSPEMHTLTSQEAQAANLPHLPVGANDLLNVVIYDSPELSGTVRVSVDGRLNIPMLPRSLDVAGLTPSQIETVIGTALEQGQILVHPVVRVTVAEYQSRTIVVLGAVHKPTSFQAFGDVTLLDAIARADGLSDTAGSEILIESRNAGSDHALVRRVSTASLMKSPLSETNLTLHGGEEIRVPEQGKVAVIGNVKHPGLFPIRQSEDASVLRLLAMSEGLAPNASDRAYIFHDKSTPGDKEPNRIDVRQILTQKAPDVQLQEGDILYIPDNHGRRVTMDVLEHLATAGALTSSAFIYATAH
jgi:polysaccharide biosynthesis/export protein